MKKVEQTLIKLVADEGKVLIKGDIVAREVYLGNNDSESNWREITEEEKQEIEAQNENNFIENDESME